MGTGCPGPSKTDGVSSMIGTHLPEVTGSIYKVSEDTEVWDGPFDVTRAQVGAVPAAPRLRRTWSLRQQGRL